MHGAPFGTIGSGSAGNASHEIEGALLAARVEVAPRQVARSGKRSEDTSAGCRANAAADLGRAQAPGGDFMRMRLEHSAQVWTERADLLERLEKKFTARMHAA